MAHSLLQNGQGCNLIESLEMANRKWPRPTWICFCLEGIPAHKSWAESTTQKYTKHMTNMEALGHKICLLFLYLRIPRFCHYLLSATLCHTFQNRSWLLYVTHQILQLSGPSHFLTLFKIIPLIRSI